MLAIDRHYLLVYKAKIIEKSLKSQRNKENYDVDKNLI